MSFPFTALQKVSSPNVTVEKFMVNFLHISPKFFDRVKKWAPTVEEIVAVMDGSESNNKCEFEKGKKALKGIMSLASYNSWHDTKYAAVTFSCAASFNFKFLTYPSAGNKILSITYPGAEATLRRVWQRPKNSLTTLHQVFIFLILCTCILCFIWDSINLDIIKGYVCMYVHVCMFVCIGQIQGTFHRHMNDIRT